MQVIISGATGFIGSELTRSLMQNEQMTRIYLLIRSKDKRSANERLDTLISHWRKYFDVDDVHLAKLEVIPCDLNQETKVADHLDAEIFFHCAASTDLGLPLGPSRMANVYATQRALRLARRLPSLKRFVHFSTAYASGMQKGLVCESSQPRRFNNAYEQSKFEAEQCVMGSGLPYSILRPSIVVGDSTSGYVKGFKIIYTVLRVWLSGRLPRAPLDLKACVDIVPVDYVVKAAIALSQDEAAQSEVINLCAGSQAPSPIALAHYAFRVFNVSNPRYAPQWVASVLSWRWLRPFLGYALAEIIDVMRWHIPYLGARGRVFDTTKSQALLQKHHIGCPPLESYGETMFQFCKDSHWGKKPVLLRRSV